MSNDIRTILERLTVLESRITPVDVKHGLNADQKSVKQLPALFKPKDISPTLSKTPYQKHPMDGWLVGEEEETDEAVVLSKDLAIHNPEGERFANPDADARVNTAAKWKEVGDLSMATTPGYVAGYPNTDNKNVNVDIKGGPGGSGSVTTGGVATQSEKDMGPADVVKALPGMKEGNIPDKIPSPLDVINYKDYTRSMKDAFGSDWTPDPEPMKPYDTKNLGPTKYSQPPVEEELNKILKHAGVKHKVKEVAPDEQGGSTGGSVEVGTIPHSEINLDADDIPWHASGTLPGEQPVAEMDEEADKEVVESAMSRIDYLMQEIGAGDVDIYDIYANPKTEEERYASKIVNRMYDDVSVNHGLHPDDNFEEILDIVADQIAQDYPMDNTINEAKVDEEKLLDKVKKSLTDYLASVEEKLEKKIDRDLGEKPKNHDLGKKQKKDQDLVAKEKVKEDPTQEDPVIQTPTLPQQDPTYAESYAVKTIEMAPGKICEIHGNEKLGFEIRHGNRKLPSRFRNLDEAVMAVEMFRSRQHKQDQSADYIEEA
jgi:hypothetical protein